MPKDPELIANFHRDKEDLSRLVEMLREDASLRSVSISYPPSPEKAIDEPRLRDYRNLMSRTRIGSIFASRGKGGAALPKDQTVKFSSEYGLSPEKAIDEPRLRDYRNLMSRTRIGSIFASRGKGGAALPKDQTVKFSSEYGLSLSQSKGYFYSEVEPRPLRESLDLTENDARVPPYQSHYKRIDGNWYLYLESLSD